MHGWRWLLVGFALTFLWMRLLSPHGGIGGAATWLPCLAPLTVLRFIWLNRSYSGLRLAAVGALLNFAVMATNGGLMPIAPAAAVAVGATAQGGDHRSGILAHSKDRIMADTRTHLALLEDRFRLHLGNRKIVSSLGDGLILLGCLVALSEELWRQRATDP